MYTKIKPFFPLAVTGLIGLFFILILHFKISYTLLPLLASVIGLGVIAQHLRARKNIQLSNENKWIIGVFFCYFLLFVISMLVHHGRGRELDLPSKLLFVLPALAVFYHIKINQWWIVSSLLLATIIGGIVAFIQHFGLKMEHIFSMHMYIQSGGIIMSLAFFALVIAFFCYQRKLKIWVVVSLFASILGVFTAVINQSRGSWIIAPLLFFIVLWLNRQMLSKRLLSLSVVTLLVGGMITGYVAGNLIEKRWNEATNDITQYVEKNNGNTSLGARFDMWKSALIGIQEKPVLGWGAEGVKEMRKQHHQQKLISDYAMSFDHAHNQYLHDTSVRGVFGLGALLAIFMVPLILFCRNMRKNEQGSWHYLWGSLGIIHIVAVMGYCLTQSFLSHNSGIMFYSFTTIVFLGLQKMAKERPLEAEE